MELSIGKQQSSASSNFIINYKIEVFCLVETFLKPGHKFSIPYFNTLSIERDNNAGGGVAVLLKKCIKYSVLNGYYNNFIQLCKNNLVETLIIRISTGKDTWYHLIVVYSPPSASNNHRNNEPQFWNHFFQFCENFENLILCGDFNATCSIWALNKKDNKEGRRMEVALGHSKMICMNNNEDTWTSKDLTSQSTLDLTFLTPDILNQCEWAVLESTYSSDHYPIKFTLKNAIRLFKTCRSKIVLNKMNWETF